jgi:hypothetical protein
MSGIGIDERRLEHVRTLIAATERDDRALRVALVLVHEALRRALATPDESVGADPRPRFDAERWDDGYERIASYQALVERVRERTIVTVPPGARVAVVSRGDDRLLQLDGRFAAHFPQDTTGRYAGYYPKEAHQAIRELCDLGSRGVQFVVFPATAFWWFDFYEGLASWLAPALVWSCEDCAVYDLGQLPDVKEGSA